MSQKFIIGMIILLLVMFFFSVAQASFESKAFIPLVLNSYEFTPTPTQSVNQDFQITHLENDPPYELDEYVTIKNISGKAADMTGWVLKNDHNPADKYTFPDGFTLLNTKSVKVWTKSGEDSNTDLYWGLDYPVWNSGSDCAWLRNDDNDLVANYCYE